MAPRDWDRRRFCIRARPLRSSNRRERKQRGENAAMIPITPSSTPADGPQSGRQKSHEPVPEQDEYLIRLLDHRLRLRLHPAWGQRAGSTGLPAAAAGPVAVFAAWPQPQLPRLWLSLPPWPFPRPAARPLRQPQWDESVVILVRLCQLLCGRQAGRQNGRSC